MTTQPRQVVESNIKELCFDLPWFTSEGRTQLIQKLMPGMLAAGPATWGLGSFLGCYYSYRLVPPIWEAELPKMRHSTDSSQIKSKIQCIL